MADTNSYHLWHDQLQYFGEAAACVTEQHFNPHELNKNTVKNYNKLVKAAIAEANANSSTNSSISDFFAANISELKNKVGTFRVESTTDKSAKVSSVAAGATKKKPRRSGVFPNLCAWSQTFRAPRSS